MKFVGAMKSVGAFCFYVLMTAGIFSCIRHVDVPIRNNAQNLVVEGSVSNDAPPYRINLSYSGAFSNVYHLQEQVFITDAVVVIKDDAGDSVLCTWIGNGTYESSDTNFRGTVGRSYSLSVRLSDGKTYITKPELMQPVPPIDSVTVVYDPNIGITRPTQFIVSSNTKDPAGTGNYYRWTASGYFPRKSVGDDCQPLGAPPGDCYPYLCLCHALCSQFAANTQVNILSDKYIDGRNVIEPVYFSPVYWKGKHFIDIRQQVINESEYNYLTKFTEQANRSGSILDPLPAVLIGNVYNKADSLDFALGYFSVSSVSEKKVILLPFFLQEYALIGVAATYIQPGDCHADYPNTLPDFEEPPGWENAQVIELH